MGPEGGRALHGLFGMQKAGKEGARGGCRGERQEPDAASSGAVCHKLSGAWLGPGLEGAEREGAAAAAAAAIAQMEEEVESWRQGGTGPGTGEHVLHREAWHWGGPTALSKALAFRLPAPIIHEGLTYELCN